MCIFAHRKSKSKSKGMPRMNTLRRCAICGRFAKNDDIGICRSCKADVDFELMTFTSMSVVPAAPFPKPDPDR